LILGWKYTYKKVRIVNAVSDSVTVLNKTKDDLMDEARENKIRICEAELNKVIKKMIENVGERQHKYVVEKLEKWERGDEEWGVCWEIPYSLRAIQYRASESYLPVWRALTEYFISGDEEAAKSEWKEWNDKFEKEMEEDIRMIDELIGI